LAEAVDLPVPGIGHHHLTGQPPGAGLIDHVQGQPPLFAVAHLLGHTGLDPALIGGIGPVPGQVEPPVQRHRGGIGDRVQADRALAHRLLAEGAAPLVGRPHRLGARFGDARVVDHPRIGVDRLAHLGRQASLDGGVIPRGLAHELLQRLHVAVGQALGHGLDGLAPPVQHESAQVAVAPGPGVLAGDRSEDLGAERVEVLTEVFHSS